MKKKYYLLLSFTLSCLLIQSQDLIIKGKVKCNNPTESSTKGAENVIVVPTFLPSRSVLTASRPSGYFEFNTGMSVNTLQDKQVQVHLVSGCKGCSEIVKRVFVSEDQDRQNRTDGKSYLTIKDWKLPSACKEVEIPGRSADSMLQVILKQPAQPMGDITNLSALAGSPALLNLLSSLVSVASTISNDGLFRAFELGEGSIQYGQFLFASAMYHTANTGFNFSPNRDGSEAVFWNPAAIAQSKKPYNISLLTNFRNNGKLGGYFRLNEKLFLGAGVIYTMQDEFRSVRYAKISNPLNIVLADSVLMKLDEFAIFLSPSYRITPKISIGLSAKYAQQKLVIPSLVNITSEETTYTDTTVTRNTWDVCLSANYKISPSWQAGISIMNIIGSTLYKEAFVPDQEVKEFQNQRAAGVGITYKWQRLNAGVDVLFTENGLYDACLGINYVPFNYGLISAGIAFKQLSYSFSFRLKHFRIAFISDNEFLINEKRIPKTSILDGRIYGGFVFDF